MTQFGIIGTLNSRRFLIPFPEGSIGQLTVDRVIPLAPDARLGHEEYEPGKATDHFGAFVGKYLN